MDEARPNCRAFLLAIMLAGGLVAGPTLAAESADTQLFRAQEVLAQSGQPKAQYHFGEMHELGLGTPPNLTEAFYWYTSAAQQGYAPAQRKISMRGQIEVEQALARAAEETRRKNIEQAARAPVLAPNRPAVVEQGSATQLPPSDPQALAREQRREALRRRLEYDAGLRLDRPAR